MRQTVKTLLLLLCVSSLLGANVATELHATKTSSVTSSTKPPSELIQVGCDNTCCSVDSRARDSCDRCETICCPKRVEGEVKKHCWKVESKLVCIPSFRWPWQLRAPRSPDCGDGCDCGVEGSRCGKVRCVNVLEKHEFTCKKCSYEWEAKCVRSSSRPQNCSQACCPRCGCE